MTRRQKSIYCVLIATALVVAGVMVRTRTNAQKSIIGEESAQAIVPEPPTLDFGVISRTQSSVSGFVRLRNISNHEVVILSAKATCGCTNVSLDHVTILPKCTLNVPISVHSMEDREISSEVGFVIQGNDALVVVPVHARFYRGYDVDPHAALLAPSGSNHDLVGEISIKYKGPSELSFIARNWPKNVSLELLRTMANNGDVRETYRIKIANESIEAEVPSSLPFSPTVTGYRGFDLPVFISHHGTVIPSSQGAVWPTQLSVGFLKSGERCKVVLHVATDTVGDFKLTGTSADQIFTVHVLSCNSSTGRVEVEIAARTDAVAGVYTKTLFVTLGRNGAPHAVVITGGID